MYIIFCEHNSDISGCEEILGVLDSYEKAEQCLRKMGFIKPIRKFIDGYSWEGTFGKRKDNVIARIEEYPTNMYQEPFIGMPDEPEWKEL